MDDLREAYAAGAEAALAGAAESTCPHRPEMRLLYAAWRQGWCEEHDRQRGRGTTVDHLAGLLPTVEKQNWRDRWEADRRRREANYRPLWLMHEPWPDHFKKVAADMRRLGSPTITCIFTDDALYALEGVHRLHAASKQFCGLSITLHCLALDTKLTDEQGDRLFGDRQYVWAHGRSLADVIDAGSWNCRLTTYRDRILAPGTYQDIEIFGSRFGPYNMRMGAAAFHLTPKERLLLKRWRYSEEENKYRKSAGALSVTVYRAPGGWQICIFIKKNRNDLAYPGTRAYKTADAAMANLERAIEGAQAQHEIAMKTPPSNDGLFATSEG